MAAVKTITRDDVLATLKAAEPLLKKQGVAHAALFGSVARGEQHADSDVDFMVELQDGMVIGVYGFVMIMHTIAGLFAVKVDVCPIVKASDRLSGRAPNATRSMLSERARDALDRIRINVEAIRDFLEGMSFQQFAADRRTF